MKLCDNLINQRVAQRLLEKLGYHVDVAANGREAVKRAASAQYAAILMDCYVGFAQNPESPWTQLQWPEVYRNSVAALLLLSVPEEALPNCSVIANVCRSYYSGKAYWPSMWKWPVTPGAPVFGWPPPMLMV